MRAKFEGVVNTKKIIYYIFNIEDLILYTAAIESVDLGSVAPAVMTDTWLSNEKLHSTFCDL